MWAEPPPPPGLIRERIPGEDWMANRLEETQGGPAASVA